MLVRETASVPALTFGDAKRFRCGPSPVFLDDSGDTLSDMTGLALRLRDSLDTCRDKDAALIKLATTPPDAAIPATPAPATKDPTP
jgi:hypothetical protein